MILSLPDEIIAKIFSFVSTKEIISNVLTCTKLNNLIHQDDFWINYNIKDIYKYLSEKCAVIKKIKNMKPVWTIKYLLEDIYYVLFDIIDRNYIFLHKTHFGVEEHILYDQNLLYMDTSIHRCIAANESSYITHDNMGELYLHKFFKNSTHKIPFHINPCKLKIYGNYLLGLNTGILRVMNLENETEYTLYDIDIENFIVYGNELVTIPSNSSKIKIYDIDNNVMLSEHEFECIHDKPITILHYDKQILAYQYVINDSIVHVVVHNMVNKKIIHYEYTKNIHGLVIYNKCIVDFNSDMIIDCDGLIENQKLNLTDIKNISECKIRNNTIILYDKRHMMKYEIPE